MAYKLFTLNYFRFEYSSAGIVSAKSSSDDARAVNSTRDVFQTCLNTSRIEEVGLKPLTRLMASYGQWPVISTNWSTESSDWQNLSASLTGSLARNYLLEVANDADIYDDPDNNIIYVSYVSMKTS